MSLLELPLPGWIRHVTRHYDVKRREETFR